MDKSDNLLVVIFKYFVENIEPYYFVLFTNNNKAMIIKVDKSNLGHLIGHEKSSNPNVASQSGTQLYKSIKNGKIKSLFDIIDKERFENNELTLDETFIYYKINNFITIFDSFITDTNLRIYTKMPGCDFDTDYLQVKIFDDAIGYLGIIGSDKNDYHFFNSIILEKNRNKNYKSIPFQIKKLEKIHKDDFNISDYTVLNSKRNKTQNNKTRKTKQKSVNYKKIKHKINNSLRNGLEIKLGEFGKNSIQLYNNKQCVEKHLEKLISSLDIQQIIDFINKTY